jgi:hypothetical protein
MKAPAALTECSPERFRLALFRAGAAFRMRFAPPIPPAVPTQLSSSPPQSAWETYPVSVAIHLTVAIYVFSAIFVHFGPGTVAALFIALACVIFAPVVPTFTLISLALCITTARRVVPPLRRVDPKFITNPIHWILLLGASVFMTRIPIVTRWVGWFWLVATAANMLVSVALRFGKRPQAGGAASAA